MQLAATPTDAMRVAKFLGLRDWRKMDDLELVEHVEAGLPVSTVDTIVRKIDPKGTFIRAHDIIPKATYHRRKAQGKPLTREQSEKVLALARVLEDLLRQYHGDTKLASMFLIVDHPLLGGRTAIDVAKESIAGAQLVLDLLARAESGVYV